MALSGNPKAKNVRGVVSWFSPSIGYGNITSDRYDSIFVDDTQVRRDEVLALSSNPRVIFDLHHNASGLVAQNVCIIKVLQQRQGTVKWYNNSKGFGYLVCDYGDVKVGRRDILHDSTLRQGSTVTFDLEKSFRHMKACKVRIAGSFQNNILHVYDSIRLELINVAAESVAAFANASHDRSLSSTSTAEREPASAGISNDQSFVDVVGSVSFWNPQRHFGFIKCTHGKVYFNRSGLIDGMPHLDRGDIVNFDIETTDRGLKAVNIRYIPDNVSLDFNRSDDSEYGAAAAFIPFEDLIPDYDSSSSSDIDIPNVFLLGQITRERPRNRRCRRSRNVNNVASGLDSARFVDDKIPQQLICPICLGVFNDPVQAPCEHAFCKGCIYRWLREDGLCPVDRQPLEEEDLKQLPLLLRGILGQLQIRCVHKGCDSVVNLDDIKEHEDKCSFKAKTTEGDRVSAKKT